MNRVNLLHLARFAALRHQLTSTVATASRFVWTRTYSLETRRRVNAVKLVETGDVDVQWLDGGNGCFHGAWLRHNCHCQDCLVDHCEQKSVEPAQLANVRVNDASVSESGVDICFIWSNKLGEHRGYIPLQWLKQNRYSDELTAQARQDATPQAAPKGHIPEVNYEGVMSSDKDLWSWLDNVNSFGFCVVNNVPTKPGAVISLGERVSHIQETIYGKEFDIKSTPNPINIAYTGLELPLHMDLVYYESPPGMQLFHCLSFDEGVTGGHSTLLDTYPVLEQMRKEHHKEFQTLCRVPATFQKIHSSREKPVHMVKQTPHVILGDGDEIVAVNWAPAFEGPLFVPPGDLQPYYEAYSLLGKLFNTSDRILRLRAKPGQTITINNRRMLHGRTAFQNTHGGERFFQGAYINIDELKSRFKVLNNIYGNEPVKRVFNYSVL